MGEARRTLRVLRQCGLHVYLDAAGGIDELPALELDGVLVDRGDDRVATLAHERRLDVVVRWPVDPIAADDAGASPATAVSGRTGLDHSALLHDPNAVQALASLDERPISGGRAAQMATGRPITLRK